jgi:CDP-glucose 4,6-dehydratase
MNPGDLQALSGRRVFLTGHTGFKGSWLALWLRRLGASVYGYALPPDTEPSHYALADVRAALAGETLADVRDAERLASACDAARPDLVLHLAAQPLVREGYASPRATFETNVMGTVNLLEAVRRRAQPCAAIVVTSDKCYENREQVWGYRECDAMGGHDPYSASKGATELVVASYRRSFFPAGRLAEHGVRLASARAGNAIGGGDWARDRIVVDAVQALAEGRPLRLRNPRATRPWQHVLEPLGGYLCLAVRLLARETPVAAAAADAWNFGPAARSVWSVRALADALVRHWGSGAWEDASTPDAPHEAGLLALNCDKACHQLGWIPVWDVEQAVSRTVAWYRAWLAGRDARTLSLDEIEAYSRDAARLRGGERT